MRLNDLDPEWLRFLRGPPRCGLAFRCPCSPTCDRRLHVMFTESVDGFPAPPREPGCAPRWHVEGATFETLTLSPSVDASGQGHWHGFIRNGRVEPA